MKTVTGTSSTDALYQTLSATLGTTSTDTTAETDSTSTSETQSDFAALLTTYLAPNGGVTEVSEEELFAGLVEQRLKVLKGDDAAAKYQEALEKEKSALKKADGFIPYEEAAKNALKSLRNDETITSEEGDKIYSEAFAAAQIDDNKEALWDNRGGVGDATKAVEAIQSAILLAQNTVESWESGSTTLTTRSLDETAVGKSSDGAVSSAAATATGNGESVASVNTPNGTTMDGADNFLFKPISNNENKLAVLLPNALKGLVESLVIKDANGNVVDEGRSTGYGDTGEREKYAFSKQGGEYSQNITVEARLSDGTTRVWEIPDPSQRYD